MDELNNGERQVAPSIEEIRRDHVARYEWIAKRLNQMAVTEGRPLQVLDIACGVGYGSWLMACSGCQVTAVDASKEAIEYARENYAHHDVNFICKTAEAYEIPPNGRFDAIVCFETLEHLEDPAPLLAKWAGWTDMLIASVPNEAVFPHQGRIKFHHRHYRPFEFKELVEGAGFDVKTWHGQRGPESEVEPDVMGRTIIVTAEPRSATQEAAEPVPATEPVAMPEDIAKALRKTPDHVSIVGLGPSDAAYMDMIKRIGGRHAYCDETWVINAHGAVLDADLVFHMDDVRIQEKRAEARPEGNIARMLEWMKTHPGPIMTSRKHPDYPGLMEFPLEGVLNTLGFDYFNNTAAYAIAYAVYIGVKKISLFGIDFTYPDAHSAEKGRGCCEYWIGIAMARGIEIVVSGHSTLLDANVPADQKPYGYDTVHIDILEQPDRSVKVELREREQIATAEEIEDRYDHTKHPAGELAEVA